MKFKVISLPYIFQVLYVLCFTGPRYQVSVYRTIGPLVCFILRHKIKQVKRKRKAQVSQQTKCFAVGRDIECISRLIRVFSRSTHFKAFLEFGEKINMDNHGYSTDTGLLWYLIVDHVKTWLTIKKSMTMVAISPGSSYGIKENS